MSGPKRKGRKLLVATLGLAAVSYVACGSDGTTDTSGNLVAPPEDSGRDAQDENDAARDARRDAIISPRDVVANLVAPDLGLE